MHARMLPIENKKTRKPLRPLYRTGWPKGQRGFVKTEARLCDSQHVAHGAASAAQEAPQHSQPNSPIGYNAVKRHLSCVQLVQLEKAMCRLPFLPIKRRGKRQRIPPAHWAVAWERYETANACAADSSRASQVLVEDSAEASAVVAS